MLVDFSSAQAYAEWYSKRRNQPWRLAFELEREKQHVEQMVGICGGSHDPSWSNTSESLEAFTVVLSL